MTQRLSWIAAALAGVCLLAPSARGSAADGTAWLYIADSYNNRIRAVNGNTGVITTVAGNGEGLYGGDGGQATSAELHRPYGVAVDTDGNIYIADTLNNRIRKVTISTGIITTVAGTGAPSYSGDGGPATSAGLNNPTGVAFDPTGNLYIADQLNNRIRMVTIPGGIITTVAGNGTVGSGGDGGPAIDAQLFHPTGLALDANGNLYIADTGNQKVREIVSGTIGTVAGNGNVGFNCNDGPATALALNAPTGLALYVDEIDFIADSGDQCVRAGFKGDLYTYAGTGVASYGGDGGPSANAELNYPTGVALLDASDVFIADDQNHRVRVVNPESGVINTIAGDGKSGFSGDGGPATAAKLYNPTGVAVFVTAGSCKTPSLHSRVGHTDVLCVAISTAKRP